MKLRLNNVRIAFPNVFESRAAQPGAKEKFSASFIMPPDHPDVDLVRKAMAEVAKGKWGAKAADIFKQLKAQDRLCLHDGDTKAQYAGFEGSMYVNASNDLRPTVLDGNRVPIGPTSGLIYPGAYVNGVVELWAQDNQHGKRVNAALMGIQFVRHGERLAGGGVASEDDFEALPDAESGADAFDEGASDETADADDNLFG